MDLNSDRPPLQLLSAAFLVTFLIFCMFGYFIWNSYQDVKEPMQTFLLVLSLIVAMPLLITTWIVTYRKFMFYIDTRTRAEESLRKSEERFSKVFNLNPHSMAIIDIDTLERIAVNDYFVKIVGHSREKLMANPLGALGELDPDNIQMAVKAVRKGMSLRDVDVILTDSEGNTRELIYAVEGIQIGERNCMIVSGQDITERKQTEDRLRDRERVLNDTQKLSKVGGWEIDLERQITSWTEEMYRIHDLAPDTFRALDRDSERQATDLESDEFTPIDEAVRISGECYAAEDRAIIMEAFNKCLEKGVPYDLELPFTTVKGRQLWVRTVTKPVIKDSRIVKLVGNLIDITERKQSEAERERIQSQLVQSQKMESVGRLAGGVAHDFNNMLMGLMGYAQMCRDEIGDDHPISEWLEEIGNVAQRAANLPRQLLAFARKQTIAPKMLDLNEEIEEMLNMLRRLIGEDIDLAWQPCRGATTVRMDPGQIDQILANLCLNARDAVGGVGNVRIETDNVAIDAAYGAGNIEATPGNYIMLTVSDDGCGMDSETLEHIFEPFYTTKGAGAGTGLGLPTIYGIVKQNDGFVNVYSELDQGTTFRIYLPRFAGEVAKEEKVQSLGDLQGGGETILLVEDEKAIRDTFGLLLENLGYTALVGEGAEQALRLVEEHLSAGGDTQAGPGAIDLLLTDVVMPGMSGKDLANKLKEKAPQLKVIYMSGYTANVIAERGILEDGVNFLSKPISREDLAAKLREMLAK